MPSANQTYLITVSGLVQGVGFRPFIWQLANKMKLAGHVYNDAKGVKIHLNADEINLRQFCSNIECELPPLARVDEIKALRVEPQPFTEFCIVESQGGQVSTGCAPDAATCKACLDELFDPQDRRYRYPFINCTDCGPRLSIIRQIPYDREHTTMSGFEQCADCLEEYNDPSDRRFHAQPNACSACGPKVWLEDALGDRVNTDDPFAHLSKSLLEGKIVAIKGLGGFHLACDATNPEVVNLLRRRKNRPDKAFALMVKNLDLLRSYARVDDIAVQKISSAHAPAVLLDPLDTQARPLAENVAPGQYQFAFMLPYTPIHHLLFEGIEVPLVMTSGNASGSPQAISNEEARDQLSGIADIILMHDRPIQNRVDDSVVRLIGHEMQYLRKARGYAPDSLPLPPGFESAPDLIALGGELKNTLCLLQTGKAIITQHLGDLEDFRTFEQYQGTLDLYKNLYQFDTDQFVCDLHPEYLSSKFGEQLAAHGKSLLKVQHHHAHMASCLGENGYPLSGEPVLGICLDGTGYGEDETLWGGEFLMGGYIKADRVARLKPFPLIGGVKAITEPWRCMYAQLRQAFTSHELIQLQDSWPWLGSPLCETFEKMIEKSMNCPMTSSAGRLFDAVGAALGCHAEGISYEGQAAIELESLAQAGNPDVAPYQLHISRNEIDSESFWREFVVDFIKDEKTKADMALAFHKGFADAVVSMAYELNKQHAFNTVALSGGVFQNSIVYRALIQQFKDAGFEVLYHKKLPTNDAGLSYGQALIASSQLISSHSD